MYCIIHVCPYSVGEVYCCSGGQLVLYGRWISGDQSSKENDHAQVHTCTCVTSWPSLSLSFSLSLSHTHTLSPHTPLSLACSRFPPPFLLSLTLFPSSLCSGLTCTSKTSGRNQPATHSTHYIRNSKMFTCYDTTTTTTTLTLGVEKLSGLSFSSSMTSKYCVSTSLFNSGTTGGTCWRMFSHVHVSFLNQRWLFTSSAPVRPRRTSLKWSAEMHSILTLVT